jgi:hypothetical protein
MNGDSTRPVAEGVVSACCNGPIVMKVSGCDAFPQCQTCGMPSYELISTQQPGG